MEINGIMEEINVVDKIVTVKDNVVGENMRIKWSKEFSFTNQILIKRCTSGRRKKNIADDLTDYMLQGLGYYIR